MPVYTERDGQRRSNLIGSHGSRCPRKPRCHSLSHRSSRHTSNDHHVGLNRSPGIILAVLILLIAISCTWAFSPDLPFTSRTSLNADAIEVHDLLQLITTKYADYDPRRTRYLETAPDGYSAIGLREGAEIKSPFRMYLPDRLYRDFAILCTVKVDRREPAHLFAVVNPTDTVVQLGIKLSASPTSSNSVISLLYTDVNSHMTTQTLASFEVPSMLRRWVKFSFKVVGDNITLYYNCKEHSSELVMRNPKELVFDSASTLYIGQAGPLIKGSYQQDSAHTGEFEEYMTSSKSSLGCTSFCRS